MILVLLFVTVAAFHTGHTAVGVGMAAALFVRTLFRLGYRAAVRRSGIGMVKAGFRRARTGRFA